MSRVSLCTIASEIYKAGVDSRVHGLGLLRVKVIELQRLQAIGHTFAKTAVVGSNVAQVLTCMWYILSAPLACKLLSACSSDRLAFVESAGLPGTATMKRYWYMGLEGSEGLYEGLQGDTKFRGVSWDKVVKMEINSFYRPSAATLDADICRRLHE